jgi:hypothetical protein
MKILKYSFFLVAFLASNAFAADVITELKNRTNLELRNFTEITGMASNFKSLSPASPLGILGFDIGVELTSLPSEALQIADQPQDLPTFFPRLSFAKGITPNLDLEASALIPKLVESQFDMPEEVKNILIYGGGFKYTMLNEGLFLPVSFAVRASYTRVNLDFFNSDTYGADLSLSRKLSVPLVPVSVTPYLGAGYISINGEFDGNQLSQLLGVSNTHSIQDYRYFAGMSFKLFIFKLTGQADFANPKQANTYSVKLGLDI